MIRLKSLLLAHSMFFILCSLPINATDSDTVNPPLKVPPEYTDEDPTDGEVADIYLEVGVPVNPGYRRYHQGYYRCNYPFYYMDDPYYYYGPGYFHYYGRYYDDDYDDDCDCRCRRRKRRCHDD